MVYIGVDYFQVSKNKTERVLEVPMDTKTDFFGNSKNGGTKFEKVLLRVPILSVPWTDHHHPPVVGGGKWWVMVVGGGVCGWVVVSFGR